MPKYPYNIPLLQFDSKTFTGLHPWVVNKYFRVEALLRSEKAFKAYKKSKIEFRSLFTDCGTNFDPLLGEHHVLMRTGSTMHDEDSHIADLAVIMKRGPSVWWPKGGEAEILQQLRNPNPRFLYFRFDVSSKASPILKMLKPLLMAAYDKYMNKPTDNFIDQFHKETTPFGKIKEWIQYFQCYDLRHDQGLKYGPIALRIYGTHKKRDNAEKAEARASWAIRAAEDKSWPPPAATRP